MSEIYSYNFPTLIRFGPGARHELLDAARAEGMSRPLVVTDRGVSALDWFPALVRPLEALEVAVFDGVWGNPVVSQVDAGVAAYRGHRADGIIAVGGGAPMDVAKAIALMGTHEGHLFDYEDGKAGAKPIDGGRLPPIVAIPTTAGTGSEVGRSGVVSDDESKAKKIFFDPKLLPRRVLADPELTLALPAKITAATGMDALTHLVEAFLSRGFHPICDGIALEGLELVNHSLVHCVRYARRIEQGETLDVAEQTAHLAARGLMLNASMMGAIAFQKGLGVTHSCAHAMSTVFDTHHGLANGVMLPAAMRFNLETAPDRFLRMARVVEPGTDDPATFIHWIEALRAEIGIPASLDALDIGEADLDKLVAVAIEDACHPLNPRAVDADDLRAIYQDALHA